MRILPTASSALTIVIFLSGCSGSYEPAERGALEKEFSSEFGFTPTSSTTNINCKEVHVGDTHLKWMRFNYSAAVFTNIVSENYKLAAADDVKPDHLSLWQMAATSTTINPNAPNWWKLPPNLIGRVYFKENYRNDFPASYAYLFVDEAEGSIYSESSAWQ